jgi:hypothetical protein
VKKINLFLKETFYCLIFIALIYYNILPISGPLTEEIIRFISILFFNYKILYTILLAVIEFIVYVDIYGTSINVIIIRFIVILTHLCYYLIQYYFYKKYYLVNNKKINLVIGLMLAIIAHFLWNFILGKIVYVLLF